MRAHLGQLERAFAEFDRDGNGLGIDEFHNLAASCAGDQLKLNTKQLDKLFDSILVQANGHQNDDDEIHDEHTFAIELARSTSALAYPRDCREFWKDT